MVRVRFHLQFIYDTLRVLVYINVYTCTMYRFIGVTSSKLKKSKPEVGEAM